MRKKPYFIFLIISIALTVIVFTYLKLKVDDDRLLFRLVAVMLGITAGLSLFYLLKSLKPDWVNKKNNLSIVLSFLFTIITLCLPSDFFYQKFQDRDTTNLLRKSFNLKEQFYDKNEAKHHVIFAFDITRYKSTDTQLPSVLQKRHRVNAKRFTAVYETDSYREFCRAMLCAKLYELQAKNVQGRFSIYTVEDETKLIANGDISNNMAVKDAETELCHNITFHDDRYSNTDFLAFYEKLHKLVEHDIFKPEEYTKYVLYAYSDFVHDKAYRNNDEFNDKIKEIKKTQKKLYNSSIIQNLYVIPRSVKDEDNKRQYIFDKNIIKDNYSGAALRENFFFLETSDPEEYNSDWTYHKSKHSIDNIPIIFQESKKGYSQDLDFLGSSTKYYIRVINSEILNESQKIYLNMDDEEKKIITKDFIPMTNTGRVYISWQGSPLLNNPAICLDIVNESGAHCFFDLDCKLGYQKVIPFVLHLLHLLCFILGGWSAFFAGSMYYCKKECEK